MPTRTTRRVDLFRRTVLRVTELERRDTPAWWSVAAPAVPEGTPGSTDATITGNLTLNPDYLATNGVVTVWADGPVQAATMALAGTMNTVLADHARGHDFTRVNIGDDPADHLPFLIVDNGGGVVTILFEDMAGDPDADYDYNDRQWDGLPVGGTGDPIDTEDTWTWANAVTKESVTVHLVVTEPSPDKMLWHYDVTNNGFSTYSPDFRGLGAFGVYPGDSAAPSKHASSQGDWGLRGPAIWQTPDTNSGSVIVMGATAWFEFTTPPRPIVAATGFVKMASKWQVGQSFEDPSEGQTLEVMPLHAVASGPLKAPGVNDFKADIDIAGKVRVGATETVFTEENEDSIGGLVIMNSNSNNAPRQQITIQRLTDAAGQPVVGGKVELTWTGAKVELYDAATGGNKVPSGTVYNNAAGVLPKQLWVEGVEGVEGGVKVTGSGKMRDVKIKATPVGNAAGADDVSFTVLWVDVTVATDGKVSANNDKLQFKKSVTFDAAGKNTDALGIYTTVVFGETRIGWSLEGRGLVHPADFSYPGSDLSLRRLGEHKAYITPPAGAGQPPYGSNGFVEDSGGPKWQDNNPLDSGGYIYDLDFPGWATDVPVSDQVQGTVGRFRANFKQVAAITINGNNTRSSGTYLYYVRFSLLQTGAHVTNKWAVIDPPDIAGDKKAFGPDQTKLSADLS